MNFTENMQVLTISALTLEDTGWYICYVGNTIGNSTERAYLNVLKGV